MKIVCAECKSETTTFEQHRWVLLRKKGTWDDPLWFCPECLTKQAVAERLEQLRESNFEPSNLGRWCRHRG